MADLKALRVVRTPQRDTSDASGNYGDVRANRIGDLYVVEYMEDLAAQGRIFSANMGTVTTPLTFLVTAANRPDAWIRVPSGTTILPIKANVVLESAAGTVTEIDVRIAQNDIGNGTSSAADVAPRTHRTDALLPSNCTARQLATGDTTAETNPLSIYRRTYARADEAGIDFRGIEVSRAMMGYPVLVGAATWEIFIAGTGTQATGYVVLTWAEIPTTDL